MIEEMWVLRYSVEYVLSVLNQLGLLLSLGVRSAIATVVPTLIISADFSHNVFSQVAGQL
jgi:hypothetical protein